MREETGSEFMWIYKYVIEVLNSKNLYVILESISYLWSVLSNPPPSLRKKSDYKSVSYKR